ncbi:hypothetical protein CBS101457_004396 [Exobasidium rhododendri]|nr:hypothetical protein CBS101457_004396 [Exobasidium rhododendri]
MAPSPLTSSSSFIAKRSASSLSAGDIAGIIVGIVVVALLLLGLLIWRLLAYRKNLDPYSAKSLDSRAREKALSQTRGGHIRSTRPRDRDTMGMDESRGLVVKHPSKVEEDEEILTGVDGGDGSSHSLDGTQNLTKERLGEKSSDQGVDMEETFQGHHESSRPAIPQEFSTQDPRKENFSSPEENNQPEKSIARGCTTM